MLTKKPVNRLLPEDWHRNLLELRQTSKNARDKSFDLRQSTSYLRNEISNKTEWDSHDNTTRLSDRVYECQRVHTDLLTSLDQVKREAERLREAKEVAEKEVEARVISIQVALECLTIRERRRDEDLVRDEVELQLEEEIKTLELSRSDLEKLVLDSVVHLRVLAASRQKLDNDIRHKASAIYIDSDQKELTESTPQVSFKPDPVTIPRDSVMPADWLRYSTDNMKDAANQIKESQILRDTICVTIQARRNADETQTRSTDFALRKRLHQETRARDELHWEKDCLLQEISEQEKEISRLTIHLQSSALPLKVVQTRLENRKWRDGLDIVDDAPQEGLRAEVDHLRISRDLLRKNLASAKEALHALQRKLRTVDADLVRKSLSVNLEIKSQDTRKKLHWEAEKVTLTEKNLTLTGSLRAHPTSLLQ